MTLVIQIKKIVYLMIVNFIYEYDYIIRLNENFFTS